MLISPKIFFLARSNLHVALPLIFWDYRFVRVLLSSLPNTGLCDVTAHTTAVTIR